MATVMQVQPKNDPAKGLVQAVPGIIGQIYGGPVGGAAGGAVGQGIAKQPTAVAPVQSSSPVDRRMQSQEQDPLNQLKQGKAALASMDSDTQASLSPVLDEAIKKAALERQQRQQGGY